MAINNELIEMAKSLQLFNFANDFEKLIKKTTDEKLSIEDSIMLILTEECKDKQKRFALNRVSRANINPNLSFENFDFSTLTNENETLIRNIMNTDFVKSNMNFFLIGNHGVGKTHIGSALVIKACFDGKTGFTDNVKSMCRKLVIGHKNGDWYNVAKNYLECDVLFLQDVATTPLDIEEVAALYEIVAQRENRGSIIVESCISTKHWFKRMAEEDILVSGIIDRLKKNFLVIKLEGKSYRANVDTK